MNCSRLVLGSALLFAGGTFANTVTVDPTTGETLYVFDTVGAFSWTATANQNVELLVVGGGGGGGCGNFGGGGGGGQVYHSATFAVTQGSVYSGTVGAGGKGGANGGSSVGRYQGGNGGDSVFGAITCPGGGGGGGNSGSAIKTGVAGGNSGGASGVNWSYTSPAATGTDDAANGWYGGHKGGDSVKSCYSGGGGGALGEGNIGSKDSDSLWHSGTGGDGYECDITGVTAYYGCGGGGGCTGGASSPYTVAIAGADAGSANASGGAGAKTHGAAGGAATNGTGSGGGGGGWYSSSPTSGGAGGSGIVAIRFVATTPIVTLTGVERFQDGTESTVAVDVVYPQSGYTVSYSESAEGPWQAAPIAKSLAGVHTVYVKVSAPNLEDAVYTSTITLKDPSAENDGTFRFVVPAGTAGNAPAAPYQTWATAANDIQTAIDAAASGDRVLVRPGTYSVSTEISLAKALTLRSYVPTTGCPDRDGTVVDAGGQSRCLAATTSSKTVNYTVDGFTFRNGHRTSAKGGGVSVEDVYSDERSVFRNCRITGCSTDLADGGGAYFKYFVTVEDCLFDDNVCTNGYGGGAYLDGYGSSLHQARGSGVILTRCVFTNNLATGKGGASGAGSRGGAAYGASSSWFEDCQFLGNIAMPTNGNARGGAIYAGPGMTFVGCRFADNRSWSSEKVPEGNYAGDIFAHNNMTISNCTFKGSRGGYGSMVCTGDHTLDIRNSVFEAAYSSAFFWDGGSKTATFRNCLFRQVPHPLVMNTGSGISDVENCTFVGSSGNAIRLNTGTMCAYVRNCLFDGNGTDFSLAAKNTATTPFTISDTRYTQATLPDRTDAARLIKGGAVRFVDAEGGDYRLRAASPLRERGAVLDGMADATDLDGRPRILDRRGRTAQENPAARPDIGCYECADKAGTVLFLK